MAGAVRKSDIAKGHGCFPDTPIIEGSPDVFINGRPAARSGDVAAPYGYKPFIIEMNTTVEISGERGE
ncbi:PAAR domain-containing protein [Pluralibacter gergoviae]|uniref:PAAR domain-containing protein n=1 Tax=Pluralibacter gergoviae TaxID=61647 RepID=UPI0005BAB9F2|nr:PAAR domain-containing protein [Pluralibacter gergoviae]